MHLLSRFRISGHSMVPSLLPGDEILISSLPLFFSKPQLQDIVLLTEPHSQKKVIKRIVKHEGEKYFVRGDNSQDSYDSRQYGWVSRKDIVGKMLGKL